MAVRRNVLFLVGGLALLIGIGFFAVKGFGDPQTPPAPKVGVVDTQKVFEQYIETIEANKRLGTDVKRLEDQGKTLNDEIVKLEEQFAKQRLFIDDQAKLAQMDGEIRRKKEELNRFVRTSQQALDERRDELSEPILKKIREMIQEIAVADGYSLVLEKQLIALYHLPEMDLTERMVTVLNERAAKEQPQGASPSSQTPEKSGAEEKPSASGGTPTKDGK